MSSFFYVVIAQTNANNEVLAQIGNMMENMKLFQAITCKYDNDKNVVT